MMGKPKSRVGTAAVAGMLGVSSSAPSARVLSDVGPAPGRAEGVHPVRDRAESGVARADNALVLDPRRVIRRGHYVRPFTDDRRFRELVAAIAHAGNSIHVPILVRVEGAPGAVEYVLVDGTHRLEAALRLGVQVPAVNLGRITSEQAFAIQAMANEVRASMHVVDQAAYVVTLLAQGLTRETVQRTTGFSAGRVSELASIGAALGALSDADRARARLARGVTHRALRTLKAEAPGDRFRLAVLALVEAWEKDVLLGSDSDEFDDRITPAVASPATQDTSRDLVSKGSQSTRRANGSLEQRGRRAADAGGVSFIAGRNSRGTSVTFRMAWRARGVREDPEVFIERIRDALQTIAAEATADYQVATARQMKRKRRGRDSGVVQARSWRETIAIEEAEIGSPMADRRGEDGEATPPHAAPRDRRSIPEAENPIPVPPSRRRPGDATASISPRLLAGLSLPMLAERLKGRTPKYQQLDTHLSDVERQVEETRQRTRAAIDAEAAGRKEPRRGRPRADELDRE